MPRVHRESKLVLPPSWLDLFRREAWLHQRGQDETPAGRDLTAFWRWYEKAKKANPNEAPDLTVYASVEQLWKLVAAADRVLKAADN